MGPVQLKLTSTRVSARKNTPARPLRSLLLSALLVHLEGRVISKAPKKLAANTMNTRKKMMFGSQCVASQLKISAVTPLPPTSQVMPMIAEIGTVYSRTMKRPYIIALKRPAAGEPLPLRKNDMVIGTIGNTQGVSSIAKPHSMASSIRAQSEEEPAVSAEASASAADTVAASGAGAGLEAVAPCTEGRESWGAAGAEDAGAEEVPPCR